MVFLEEETVCFLSPFHWRANHSSGDSVDCTHGNKTNKQNKDLNPSRVGFKGPAVSSVLIQWLLLKH